MGFSTSGACERARTPASAPPHTRALLCACASGASLRRPRVANEAHGTSNIDAFPLLDQGAGWEKRRLTSRRAARACQLTEPTYRAVAGHTRRPPVRANGADIAGRKTPPPAGCADGAEWGVRSICPPSKPLRRRPGQRQRRNQPKSVRLPPRPRQRAASTPSSTR